MSPVLRYWDANQNAYIAIPSAPGQTYASVGLTAPSPVSPPMNPPMGALWVDTSTSPASSAYVPSQTPPGSGLNTYQDASATWWISYNGSAWKKATDALHTRVARNAVMSWPTTAAAVPWDTIVDDPYALYSTGTNRFTCPIAGMYLMSETIYCTVTAANQQIVSDARKNGTLFARGNNTQSPGTSWAITSSLTISIRCVAGDYLQVFGGATAVLSTTYADPANNWATFDYLGTG